MSKEEEERFAAIGRAVVEYLKPNDPIAAGEATPENVVGMLQRYDGERRSLQNSKALRVGRIVLALASELG